MFFWALIGEGKSSLSAVGILRKIEFNPSGLLTATMSRHVRGITSMASSEREAGCALALRLQMAHLRQ